MNTCIIDGCKRTNGPEDLEVFYQGESIGFICSEHIGRAKALKLVVSRKDRETFNLIEATEIPGPLD